MSVTNSMKRTLIVFAALVSIVFVIDVVSRRLLGLDCIGAVLPVWGCVAQPYPGTFSAAGDLSTSIVTYGGILAGLVLVAFMLKDLVFGAAGYLLGRYRPDLVKKMSHEEPHTYRVR